jgi:hypothetical protein
MFGDGGKYVGWCLPSTQLVEELDESDLVNFLNFVLHKCFGVFVERPDHEEWD